MNIDQKIQYLVNKICSFRWRIIWWSPIFDIFKTQQAGLKLLSILAQKGGFWATTW